MSRIKTQSNETFGRRHETQNRDTTSLKTNGSKTSSSFEK